MDFCKSLVFTMHGPQAVLTLPQQFSKDFNALLKAFNEFLPVFIQFIASRWRVENTYLGVLQK